MKAISKKTAQDIVEILRAINKDISLKLKMDQEIYNRVKNLELELNAKVKFLDYDTIALTDQQVTLLNKAFGPISEHFAVYEMKLSDELAKQIWEISYRVLE